jgi:hypothetical protein
MLALYLILMLISVFAAGLIILLLKNLNALVDTVRYWSKRPAPAYQRRLHLVRYVVPSKRHPSGMEIRHTPYSSASPSPVWDGKFRRPWGW